jgi:hypothetical protein
MISFTDGILELISLKDVCQRDLIQNVLHEGKNRYFKILFIVDLSDYGDDDASLYSDVNVLSYPNRNMHVSGLYRGHRCYCKTMEPDVFVNNLLLNNNNKKTLYVFDDRFKEKKSMVEFIMQIYPSFFRRPYQRSCQLLGRLREAELDRIQILQAKRFNGFARMMENSKTNKYV